MKGPGKYDEIATATMVSTDAQAVVLIVARGIIGSGFSAVYRKDAARELMKKMPTVLRDAANQIEEDLKTL